MVTYLRLIFKITKLRQMFSNTIKSIRQLNNVFTYEICSTLFKRQPLESTTRTVDSLRFQKLISLRVRLVNLIDELLKTVGVVNYI